MDIVRRHAPTESPRGTVLISHGYAEHQGRFTPFADALLAAGYDVCAYDHAGHGTAEGPRARVDVGRLILDHLDARRSVLAHARTPGIFLFGHSMGGLVTASSALLDRTALRGVVLTGPAFRPLPRVPLPLARALGPVARMMPWLPAATAPHGVLAHDPAVEDAFDADPLNHHGPVPLLTGTTMVLQGAAALRNAAMMRIPLLVLHGADDRLTSPTASREFVDAILAAHPGADATFRLVDGALHEVLNEACKDEVTAGIIEWMDAR